jgi:uncharacterized transporter YbjL
MVDNASGDEHSERVSSESTSSAGVKYFLTKAGIVVFAGVVGMATASYFAFSLKPSIWQIILYLVLVSLVSTVVYSGLDVWLRLARSRTSSCDA